nr:MAG TPA_asm: hypothetical protein [Caudoviricetes sp.]
MGSVTVARRPILPLCHFVGGKNRAAGNVVFVF